MEDSLYHVFIIYESFVYLLANKAVDLADSKHFCNRFVMV